MRPHQAPCCQARTDLACWALVQYSCVSCSKGRYGSFEMTSWCCNLCGMRGTRVSVRQKLGGRGGRPGRRSFFEAKRRSTPSDLGSAPKEVALGHLWRSAFVTRDGVGRLRAVGAVSQVLHCPSPHQFAATCMNQAGSSAIHDCLDSMLCRILLLVVGSGG